MELARVAVAKLDVLIRAVDGEVEKATTRQRSVYIPILGALLYRAVGRFAESHPPIQKKGIRTKGGEGAALVDWAFLAMAHHRLGHGEEARRWLDCLRNQKPNNNPGTFWDELFWDELEMRLIQPEAEAVILYDPIFPADPFFARLNRRCFAGESLLSVWWDSSSLDGTR